MKNLYLIALACILYVPVYAQTANKIQPFGKIDTADLRLKECDFEKGAGAMVLFEKGELLTYDFSSEMTYHKRVKIFNDAGKEQANIRVEYINKEGYEDITEVEAQTINLDGNTINIISVDKKQIVIQKVDNYTRAISFTMPGVRSGSVIEIKYKWETVYNRHFPTWRFQSDIPVRYSELVANLRGGVRVFTKVKQPFAVDKSENLHEKKFSLVMKKTWAMANVRPYSNEAYMAAADAMIQRILFFHSDYSTWATISGKVKVDKKWDQLKTELYNTDSVLTQAAAIKEQDKRTEYIFDYVKNKMIWNKKDDWNIETYLNKVWEKKTGNATEINLVLHLLLAKAGIKTMPVLVSTPDNGFVEKGFPAVFQFNRTVLYLPLKDSLYTILDAADKDYTCKQIPYDVLNTYGLAVNTDGSNGIKIKNAEDGVLFNIRSLASVHQLVNIDAEIKPDGKMDGKVVIQDQSYSRNMVIEKKNELEAKYANSLAEEHNEIKVSGLQFENLEVDSLPLIQKFDFTIDLNQADDNYLYFNTNLFSGFRNNPFIGEERYSNVQFSFPLQCIISGVYKIPANYKLETVPKTLNLKTEESGLSIRRMIAQEENTIVVRFIIERKRNFYTKDQYSGLREFYRKMFDILNEQVILKKQ